MTSVSYPTGASGPAGGSYTFGFYSMGRPSTMSDTGATLISGTTYGPAGELLTMTGTGYSESRSYNSRLQLTALNGVSLSYPTTNNGKISSQTDSVSAVSNGTWGQTYAYDGFGNLTAKTPAAGKTSATYSAAFSNNRETGLSYDANGNQISDVTNYASLQFDVENRLAWGQKGSSSNGNGYGYDPSNRRVYVSTWTYSTQWNLSNEEVTFWGVGGQRMAKYSLSTSGTLLTATGYNVYFGSKLVRKIDAFGTAGAVQPDRLGSFGKFAPYGEERTSTADNTEKFATYYREGNTGLDYAMNRYYNSVSGRFLSPDPYQASGGPGDPGSWNRYDYVQGDPVNRIDRLGTCYTSPPPEHEHERCFPVGPQPPQTPKPLLPLDPPGSPDPSGSIKVYIDAFFAALKALQDPKCKALFNTDPSRPHTFDPATVLSSFGLGGSDTPDFGTLRIDKMNLSYAAVTVPDRNTSAFIGNGVVAAKADIVLQGSTLSDNYYLRQSVADLATTMIHELGHVFNIVSGLGGSAIVNDVNLDGSTNYAAENKNAATLQACNPK